jgi:integrase/recombinase XerD
VSALAGVLEDYLALRRAVGFKVGHLQRDLPTFVAFCDAEGAGTITVDVALRWAGQRANAPRRLGAVRVFARYVQALDPATEVPPPELLPQRSVRRVPRLLSDDEVAALMAGCRRIGSAHLALTTETVIGLLWSSGIRVVEALRLGVLDVDLDEALLVVERSKGHKSRLVPIAPSSVEALADYRDRRPDEAGATFFVGERGGPLHYVALRAAFVHAVTWSALEWDPPPRLGDFRHGFAVRTLLDWYRSGQDVQAMLPRLSTYLGHTEPASTYWYLSAAPELMAIVAERLERHQARP